MTNCECFMMPIQELSLLQEYIKSQCCWPHNKVLDTRYGQERKILTDCCHLFLLPSSTHSLIVCKIAAAFEVSMSFFLVFFSGTKYGYLSGDRLWLLNGWKSCSAFPYHVFLNKHICVYSTFFWSSGFKRKYRLGLVLIILWYTSNPFLACVLMSVGLSFRWNDYSLYIVPHT